MHTTDTAPAIPGLTFRQWAGEADWPALLAVNNGSKIADGLDWDLHTLDTLRAVYAPTAVHDPARDLRLAAVDGQVVAYARLVGERELDGTRVFWHVGFVLPQWRNRGLGHALFAWAESTARARAAAEPDDGPVVARIAVHGNMAALKRLGESLGYTPARYEFHMETPDLDHIPAAPLPPGLEIRPALAEHYRAIWAASAEAFRDHWGATEVPEDDFAHWLEQPLNRQPDLWVVAWAGDEVAGSILNYIPHDFNARSGRRLGYTESITVRRPWRRLGLARAMLARSMQIHQAHGMTQTGLGVDTENPSGALRLYESMGYQVVSQSTEYRKTL